MSRRRNRRNNPRQASSPPQTAEKPSPRASALPSEIDSAVRLRVQETLAIRAKFFSGPLPPPEHLAAYERTMSGAAKSIFQAFETEGEHRRSTESKVVDSNIRLESRGQIFGFVIAMTALIGGIGLMAFDKSISGAAISLSALATLAGVFVWSKRQKKRELGEKSDHAALGGAS